MKINKDKLPIKYILVIEKDLPDYMRGFDVDEDWGITAVAKPVETTPSVDAKVIETNNLELSKVKSDVGDIKSMMNEIMQIVAEKDTITEEVTNEVYESRFKEIEKVILPFLYNLSKSD